MSKLYVVLVGLILFPTVFFTHQVKAATSPLGSNIISNGTVYTILSESGKTVRRPYTSAGAFLSYSFNSWTNLLPANSDDLGLPIGSFIPPRDGTIMCSDRYPDQGTCYLVSDRKKAGFTNETAFSQLGFSYQYALYGDVSFLQSASHIESGAEKHRSGTVLSWNSKNYIITNAGLKEISSTQILESWGYWSGDIIPANSSDWQFAIGSKLSTRKSSEITPDLGPTTTPKQDTLKIETSSLPDAKAGQSYSKQMKASGGSAPYRWSTVSTTYQSTCCVLGLSSPPGGTSDYYGLHEPVFFNTQAGSTVPLEHIGTYSWTFKVTDANGATVTKTFSLKIAQQNALTIETSSLPDAKAGQPYSQLMKASGGSAPYRWSTVSTTYPSSCCTLGLSGLPGGQTDYYGIYGPVYFNTQSGSSVPTEYGGTYTWTIKVTDANGVSVTKTLNLTIAQ